MHQEESYPDLLQRHDLNPDLFQPKLDSAEEREQFRRLQSDFALQVEKIFPDNIASKTIVIVPSLTIDQEILSKVDGAVHYEERLLCLLMLLRMPRTHVIYVTSVPVDPVIVDYYLHLLPGITGYHARQRLTLFSCFDSSKKSLTQKILERPRLIERIKKSIPLGHAAHIACFNTTKYERTLAVQLNLPVSGCDPELLHYGTKSGSRKIFKECGIPVPAGFEDLRDETDMVEALAELKLRNSGLKKAVVKLEEGFSGGGNAIFSYENSPENGSLKSWIRNEIPKRLQLMDEDITIEIFLDKFKSMGGIAEEMIPGTIKQSPSVQCRINPLGMTDVISTHDQLLGGSAQQTFIGANFPANIEYAPELGKMGKVMADALRNRGVIGRFSADFISVKEDNKWKHYALEINLRKGGTTHPFLMLQGLTDGKYDAELGIYVTASGQQRYYFSSDNVQSEMYQGLTPHDLIDIAIFNRLQYDGSSQHGVMFHLIGALSEYGKLGVVCIGKTPGKANAFYRKTLQILNKEGKK